MKRLFFYLVIFFVFCFKTKLFLCETDNQIVFKKEYRLHNRDKEKKSVILQETPASFGGTLPTETAAVNVIAPSVTADDVAQRFYLLCRFKKPVEYLLWASKNTKWKPCVPCVNMESEVILLSRYHCLNQRIVLAINEINKQQSLRPFIKLWNMLEEYKFIHDKRFIQEFSLLALSLYKQAFEWVKKKQKNATLQSDIEKAFLLDAIEFYSSIDQLPLEDILSALDVVSEGLPSFLQQYDLYAELTWKEWLKRFWWVPPFIVLSLGIKIYMNYLENHPELKMDIVEPEFKTNSAQSELYVHVP